MLKIRESASHPKFESPLSPSGAVGIFGPGRFAMIIDGESLQCVLRTIGADIDFRKLLGMFFGRSFLVCAMYYAITSDGEPTGRRALLDWLEYNGYRVHEKRGRSSTESVGSRACKSGVSLELAVDVLDMAPRIDNLVLFSGDGDLAPAVRAVQRKGICVSAVSTLASKPPLIADRLRRQVDRFFDLRDLMPHLHLQRKESGGQRVIGR